MKVLIIRRDNIGDLICTTPLFSAIREHFPEAYIAALVNSYNAPAISGNPNLNDVFVYTKGKHAAGKNIVVTYWQRLKLIWSLRKLRFDYVLLPSNGPAPRALKLARLIRPIHIVGFAEDTAMGVNLPVSHKGGELLHETEDIFRLLQPLGITPPIPSLTVIPAKVEVARLVRSLPDNIKTGFGPLVALHISARKENQRWSVENFAELAMLLSDSHDAKFLIFWSPGSESNPFHPGDDDKAARLMAALADYPAVAIRTETLTELIAGLSLCNVAVLSDGGAMHVAAGLQKPIVCFFGSSPAHRWHPWKVPHVVLKKTTAIVEDIRPEEVANAFSELLRPS